MTPLERERLALVLVVEAGLRHLDRDGSPPGPDLRALCQRIAFGEPALAARCPWLLRAAGPEVAANVVRAAGSGRRSDRTDTTPASATGNGRASSAACTWMTPADAAKLLGIGSEAVRAAIRRGRLPAHRTATGWAVSSNAVSKYQEARRGRTQHQGSQSRHRGGQGARRQGASAVAHRSA